MIVTTVVIAPSLPDFITAPKKFVLRDNASFVLRKKAGALIFESLQKVLFVELRIGKCRKGFVIRKCFVACSNSLRDELGICVCAGLRLKKSRLFLNAHMLLISLKIFRGNTPSVYVSLGDNASAGVDHVLIGALKLVVEFFQFFGAERAFRQAHVQLRLLVTNLVKQSNDFAYILFVQTRLRHFCGDFRLTACNLVKLRVERDDIFLSKALIAERQVNFRLSGVDGNQLIRVRSDLIWRKAAVRHDNLNLGGLVLNAVDQSLNVFRRLRVCIAALDLQLKFLNAVNRIAKLGICAGSVLVLFDGFCRSFT